MNPAIAQHADRLMRAGVARISTSHGAGDNLHKISLFTELDAGTTFGMEELLRGVGLEEAYEAVTYQTGYPPDAEETPGRDERDVLLDWAGPVAVMGDGASLLHTHDPDPMRHVLRQAGAVDLAVADHGFAGAAIAAGIPTVAVMDTNDPDLAMVARRDADVTVIPMDDNRPLNSYATALEVLKASP